MWSSRLTGKAERKILVIALALIHRHVEHVL